MRVEGEANEVEDVHGLGVVVPPALACDGHQMHHDIAEYDVLKPLRRHGRQHINRQYYQGGQSIDINCAGRPLLPGLKECMASSAS